MSWISTAKNTLKNRQKWQDDRGLNLKKNYSSFWMDDDKDTRFSGLSAGGSTSTDIVKLVKLTNYRKAVTNFVKIVTKQEIPVTWAGSNSFTDGKAINLTTDIKEANFDVVVGLALHEASHIVLSDFDLLRKLMNGDIPAVANLAGPATSCEKQSLVKSILNWIEDRRIDDFIFSTSPGYKAYYHKMYDHYWNSKDIHKGFLSTEYADPVKLDSWLFQIVNSLNPSFNPTIFPGLADAIKLIDVRNITRLKSTEESLEVAIDVVKIIMEHVTFEKEKQQDKQDAQSRDGQDSGDDNEVNEPGEDGPNSADTNEDETTEDGPEEEEVNTAPELTELSAAEAMAVKKAFDAQKSFLDGETGKKATTKKLQQSLEAITKGDLTIQAVGEGSKLNTTAIMSDLTNSALVGSWIDAVDNYNTIHKLPWGDPARRAATTHKESFDEIFSSNYFYERPCQSLVDATKAGLEIGGLLGKKLQLHNESRERVDNRLRNGKIDIKRIAHAGYGIESIFKQIQVDKYKQANMHISIDASGSMSGNKWYSTITAVAAIAKGLTYTQNINLQISLRYTDDKEKPLIITIYNSKKNKLAHLVRLLERMHPTNYTPEGLCFEAMYKQNHFIAGTSDLDSYFINFSDGEPACGSYVGQSAHKHTQTWINKMKSELNIKVLSFFIDNMRIDPNTSAADKAEALQSMRARFDQSYSGIAFKTMYGKDAVAIDTTSVVEIAKSLNKTFLAAKA